MHRKFYKKAAAHGRAPLLNRAPAIAALVATALLSPRPVVAQAQNTMKVWKADSYTTCGERRVHGFLKRFVVVDTDGTTRADYAPSEQTWHLEGCDAGPTPPPRPGLTLDEAIAAFKKSGEDTCEERQARFRLMSPAYRRDILVVRERVMPEGADPRVDPDGCRVTP
jgi:hypothetical protein